MYENSLHGYFCDVIIVKLIEWCIWEG